MQRSMMVAAWALCAALVGCGGGGGGGDGGAGGSPPPPAATGPTWTPGVFEPASTFKDRCAVVRTGRDIEGDPFPDRPGSVTLENFWLRSWTNETYLWNTEVVDRNPIGFSRPVDYFAVLRTTEKTASGRDKDEFHFSIPTADYLEQINSVPRSGYGASLAFLSQTVPRDVRVLYTEPNSPASALVSGLPALRRGDRIVAVDGVDLIFGSTQTEVDALNNGLFPNAPGETHTLLVRDAQGAERSVTITSANVVQKPVNRTKVIDTPTGKVGYVLFNTFSPFSSEKDIADAIAAMQTAGISDLVLDLRYNGGGLLAVASQLSYMVAGPARSSGKVFERLRFNAAAGSTNPVTGGPNDPFPFINAGIGFSVTSGAPLPSLSLPRVYVLSTDSTCSASESTINALRGIDVEVVLIGSRTCGKPFGFYPQDNCGETYFTVQFQGVNNKNFGDYADGFLPDNSGLPFGVRLPGCVAPDDLAKELGDETERMLAAALGYRATGTCPAAIAGLSAPRAVRAENANATDLSPPRDWLGANRDMRRAP